MAREDKYEKADWIIAILVMGMGLMCMLVSANFFRIDFFRIIK